MDGDGKLGAVTKDEQVGRGRSRARGGIFQPLVRAAGLVIEHLNWLRRSDGLKL